MNKLLEMVLSEAFNMVENRLGGSNNKAIDFLTKDNQGQSGYNNNCSGMNGGGYRGRGRFGGRGGKGGNCGGGRSN